MTKLERLRVERKIVNRLSYIPAQMRQILNIYYEREIENIEKYGAENPEYVRQKRKKGEA